MSMRQKLIMMMEFTKLHKNFQQYFKIVPALNEQLIEEAYRVRHRVYCQELGWEAPRHNGMETDEFDAHAMHCLLQNVTNGEYVGCIRTVRNRPDDPLAPLPFQLNCSETLDPGIPDPEQQRQLAIAEVSRLAVIGKYRRRAHEQDKAVKISEEDFGSLKRPRFPYIPVGLYLGMLEMARRSGIKTLYILTEPSLAAHFCKLGGRLEPVGGPIEHRGTRVPYRMDVQAVLDRMNLLIKPLNRVIRDEIDQAYRELESHNLRTA